MRGIRAIFFILPLLLVSCTPTVKEVVMPEAQVEVVKKGKFYFSEEEERYIVREARRFGIKVPDREEIKRFIKFYLSRKRSLENALRRAKLYEPYIIPVLERYGLPKELALLPVIESSFNPFAVSHAGAAGIWQFMPATARKYGLRVNSLVDERFDVQKSTEAAARYLRDLYSMFGNWELALAAYNCGEGCVQRRTGGKSFWINQAKLPRETRNYVPSFFAVLLLARDPAKYGLRINPWDMEVKRVLVKRDTSVIEFVNEVGITESSFRDSNLHIKGNKIPSGTYVYIQRGFREAKRVELEKDEGYKKVITLENGAKVYIKD